MDFIYKKRQNAQFLLHVIKCNKIKIVAFRSNGDYQTFNIICIIKFVFKVHKKSAKKNGLSKKCLI